MNSPISPEVASGVSTQRPPFAGRIIQILDALDYGDAVSNHCLALRRLLEELGYRSLVISKWYHDKVADQRRGLDEVEITDQDILVLHFSGYSAQAWPHMAAQRCTKVVLYHNITPHEFFPQGTDLHDHCLKGRQQLAEVVRACHFHWGVSAYNVAELKQHGATDASSAVVPIVVDAAVEPAAPAAGSTAGSWLFVGRVAANKAHHDIVRAFAEARRKAPELAKELVFVGGYDEQDAAWRAARAAIDEARLGDSVRFAGKVTDAEVQDAFARASVYVSASRHEGFGVPLVEAAHHGLPVVALDSSGVGETLGAGPWLVSAAEQLAGAVVRIGNDAALRQQVLEAQARNAERFTSHAVRARLASALGVIVPGPDRYRCVSIVICTYNRADLLDRCLDYLKYQTNRNFEVVVVNGPSTDGTDAVIERYRSQIKLATNPQRNLSVSRNLGIDHAAGDLIAFIDDDALPFDDWVDTLLREFNARPLTTAGLGGPVYYAGSLEFQAQDIGINAFAESNVKIQAHEVGRNGWERSLLGTNTCFEAAALRAARGFDEQFDYFLDESELCFRLQRRGHLVAYSPELFLRHEFAQSHNRSGKFKYNWFTICKNTAYYVAAHSGLEGRKLEQYLAQRMQDERIAPLKEALAAGQLAQADHDRFIDDIHRGVQQGLKDAKQFPRTRALANKGPAWKPFVTAMPPDGDPEATQPLHICLITKEFVPFTGAGGIGTLYYNLASEFLLMGHRVTVLTPADKDSTYQRGRFVLRYVRKRYVCEDTLGTPGFVNNMNWSTSALHALAALHAKDPVDVIDSALWDTEALATALAPAGSRPPLVVRLVTPLPVAARLNGWNVPEYEYALYCAAERRLIEAADAVVPISDSIAATIEKEHQLKRDARWIRSHCGIAYWPFFESHLGYAELGEVNGQMLRLPEGAPMVLFVGRLEGRKGVREMLEAAVNFLAAVPEARLILAGRDVDGFAERAAKEMPAELLDRIQFLGQVDDPTREKLLHAAHCVIFPSRYESFGLVPLEAFVHGVPVVAARAGAIPEVVADDRCGLLYEAGNASELARAVQRLLTEPGLRERLSSGALRQIRHFSSRKSALRSVSLYRSLLAAAPAVTSSPEIEEVSPASN